jgi:hypothetical protein
MGKDRRDNHEGAFGLSSEHKPDGCAYKYASSCNRQERDGWWATWKEHKDRYACHVSNDRQKALNLLLGVKAPTREELARKSVVMVVASIT